MSTAVPANTATEAARERGFIDEIATRLQPLTKAQRTEAAMADDILEFAARLSPDSISFALLKAKLHALHVKLQDWTKIVQQLREANEPKSPNEPPLTPKPTDQRPKIVITTEEGEVADQAIEALATQPNLYQRFGTLVRMVDAKRWRPGEGSQVVPEIKVLTEHVLRNIFTRAASWHEAKTDAKTGQQVFVRAHPPEWCVRAVRDLSHWPLIKPLYHIAEIPVLLPDGALISKPGYDEETGILLRSKVTVPEVPERPTQEEARIAAEQLLDIVCDFPFESEERKSAWLAALLTPIARCAFSGQSPLFMLDANQSGSGKGLLLKVISWLVLGREMDFVVPTSDEEEERKRITSKVLHGDMMVLIDNIDKPFGSAVLEALLTTGTWSDRLLSTNSAPSLDVWITWYASGNNVQFKKPDTQRRCCVVRLLTKEIQPEQRSGFKYPDLEGHVLAHRGELLGAALTLLRAWLCAGQKASELPGWGGIWGSFNGWDQVVRGAIVYAGLADPIAAKPTNSTSETAQKGLRELVEGLEEAMKELKSSELLAQQIKDTLKEDEEKRRLDKTYPVKLKKLSDALSILLSHMPDGRTPNLSKLGEVFGRHKTIPAMTEAGIKWINCRRIAGHQYWRVELVPAQNGQPEEPSGNTKATPTFSKIGIEGVCEGCGASPHLPCGLCRRCPPEIGGCPCGRCVQERSGGYVQTAACNLCKSWKCRCNRCGNCRKTTPASGGCCC